MAGKACQLVWFIPQQECEMAALPMLMDQEAEWNRGRPAYHPQRPVSSSQPPEARTYNLLIQCQLLGRPST